MFTGASTELNRNEAGGLGEEVGDCDADRELLRLSLLSIVTRSLVLEPSNGGALDALGISISMGDSTSGLDV